MAGGWAIEVDIRKYFDTIDHRQLQEVHRQRIRDGVITRLVGKWLNAGVMENGKLERSEAGTPQGGIISPLLANIYLHTVLDVWFEEEVRPRLRGWASPSTADPARGNRPWDMLIPMACNTPPVCRDRGYLRAVHGGRHGGM